MGRGGGLQVRVFDCRLLIVVASCFVDRKRFMVCVKSNMQHVTATALAMRAQYNYIVLPEPTPAHTLLSFHIISKSGMTCRIHNMVAIATWENLVSYEH